MPDHASPPIADDIGKRFAESLQVAARVRRAQGLPVDPLARCRVLCRTPAGPRPVAEVVGQLRALREGIAALIWRFPQALPYSLDEVPELPADDPARTLIESLCKAIKAAEQVERTLHAQIERCLEPRS